ncbi:hypothetical protein Tco_0088618 [Tanacetum coccineum]
MVTSMGIRHVKAPNPCGKAFDETRAEVIQDLAIPQASQELFDPIKACLSSLEIRGSILDRLRCVLADSLTVALSGLNANGHFEVLCVMHRRLGSGREMGYTISRVQSLAFMPAGLATAKGSEGAFNRLSEPISRSLCQSSLSLLKSRTTRSYCVSRVLPPLRFVTLTSEPSARSLEPSARSLEPSLGA